MSSVRDWLEAVPKVELHRHLEGSLRLSTLAELAAAHESDSLLRSIRPLRNGASPREFLQIFPILRRFYRSPEVIRRFVREAIEDAYADNVRHLELRFTPAALSSTRGYALHDVTDWVIDEARQARSALPGMQISLIASVNRHEPPSIAEQVLGIAVDRKKDIGGVDLAGDEVNCSGDPFATFFRDARREGLGVTIHAGEWAGPRGVRQAIEDFGAHRIGHGIRVVEDLGVVALARDRGVIFEVCPTSNYLSGAIADRSAHPLRQMLALGLDVTINTDDPSIFNVTLTDELQMASEQLRLSLDEIKKVMMTAAAGTFQPAHSSLPFASDDCTAPGERSLRHES